MTATSDPQPPRRSHKRRPIIARRAQSAAIMPPPPVPGEPETPTLIRLVKLRIGRSLNKISERVPRIKPNPHPDREQRPLLVVTIPQDIVELGGLGHGMNMVLEGYRDGRIVMFPAGDLMSREDSMI